MPLSKRNRRGIILLVFIGILLSFLPRIISYLSSGDELVISYTDVKSFEMKVVKETSKQASTKKKNKIQRYKLPDSKFDPNEYTASDWMKLGLSEKQANVIVKFCARGVRSNKDLEKIYVFPDELFTLVKDSTSYPKDSNETSEKKRQTKLIVKLNLNSASKEELVTIPGIGPFYAGKIIQHRNELGGFVNTIQLMEIWKFDITKYQSVKEFVFVSGGSVSKLNVNNASFEDLYRHPYIDYKVANSIVKMRETNGVYTKVEDIKRSKLIDEELFDKLSPYLTL